MSLRINTNVAALNSYNNLNANQAKLEGAFQQLSSGLRINKAADDAAGMSIAQGLTSQINGLTQSVSNANDGINVAQIADGALGTTQDILQRMRSLVVKAGNEGTQDARSLQAIQKEVANLNVQLDNISAQTKFGQTNLLDGTYNFNFQVGANGKETIRLDLSTAGVQSSAIGGSDLNALNIAVNTKVVASEGNAPSTTLADAFNQAAVGLSDSFSGVDSVAANGTGKWNLMEGAVVKGTVSDNGDGTYLVSTVDTAGTARAVGTVDTNQHDPALVPNAITTGAANQAGSPLAKAIASAGFATPTDVGTTGDPKSYVISDNGTGGWNVTGNLDNEAIGSITVANGVFSFTKVGDTDPSLRVSSSELPTSSLQSYTTQQASDDLGKITAAIDAISASRSQIGAVQNQLSYTVSNLQTAITNVTASRSNLTDADLAQQVTAMTQSQILTQAATSVLAQANSAPQAILKLLQ